MTGSCKRDIGTSISITDGEIFIRLVTVSFSIELPVLQARVELCR